MCRKHGAHLLPELVDRLEWSDHHLEIADCSNRINLEFEIESSGRRQNSFHKIDTLIEALQDFRGAMAEESVLYKQRDRLLEADKKEEEACAFSSFLSQLNA